MTTNTAPKSTFNPTALAASLSTATHSAGANTADTSNTPKANVYLAIGVLRDDVDMENINPATDLINLPQMQGLDNMKPDTRKASTQEFADQQAERNGLLQDLVEQCLTTLQPGETRMIPLYVSVYRKKDEIEAAPAKTRTRVSFFGG